LNAKKAEPQETEFIPPQPEDFEYDYNPDVTHFTGDNVQLDPFSSQNESKLNHFDNSVAMPLPVSN